MRYRILSSNGDYTFGNGQADFYRDIPEAVGQAAQTRLELWAGEWFLDTEEGTLYLQGLLGTHSKDQADVVIQDRVRGTQGFAGIQNYQSERDPNTRAMTVQFSLDTIYGPTRVDIANYRNF